ncbi:MAG: tetratricopeptide repeat protein [bacterium]
MTGKFAEDTETLTQTLAARGYWPARACLALGQGKYSQAVQLCRENQKAGLTVLSGHLICARALYHAGQLEAAQEELQVVLARDPDNLVALKYLGDIRHQQGDLVGSMAHYERILQIDSDSRGLVCSLQDRPQARTRTVSLLRAAETKAAPGQQPLREIPFNTETIGDLYLAQGYPRLAAEVFRLVNEKQQSPRLAEKLIRAEQVIKDKER